MLKKIFAFLQIAVFLFVYFSGDLCGNFDNLALAEAETVNVDLDAYKQTIREGFATSPSCNMDMTVIAAFAGSAVAFLNIFITGMGLIYAGMANPEPISKATLISSGTSMTISAVGLILGLIYGSTALMCFFFSVRNPVRHYDRGLNPSNPGYANIGKMKKRLSRFDSLNARFAPTDNYWEADYAPYSEYVRVIFRWPNMLNLGIGIGCETGAFVGDTDIDVYRGRNSRLCPEEWRDLGVDFALDYTTTPGFPVMKVHKNSDNEYVFYNSGKWNKDLFFLKKNSSPIHRGGPYTSNGKDYLANYKIEIAYGTEDNTDACVYLVGYGDLPLASALLIGCHKKYPKAPYPKCSYSLPIRIDGTWDTALNRITPNTGTGRIVDYDNSECYGCEVSGSCIGNGDMRPHMAVLPFTSMAYRCVKESFKFFIQGCLNSSGATVVKSNFAAIQERLASASLAAIAIGLLLYFMGVAAGNVSQKDFFGMLMKCAVVFWLTMPNSNGRYGLQKAFDMAQSFTENFVASITPALSSISGLCNYDVGEIKSLSYTYGGVTRVTDYSYLAPWNYLDCYVSYMIAFPLLPQRLISSAAAGSGAVELGLPYVFALPLIIVASILGGPFMPLVILSLMMVGIILFLLTLYITQMVLLSIAMFTILGLLAPIFAPMLLIAPLRPVFDSWLRESVAYLLSHVLFTIFMMFIIQTIHPLYFGNTSFVSKKAYLLGIPQTLFFVNAGNVCTNNSGDFMQGEVPCGCDRNAIACWLSGFAFETKEIALGIKVTGLNQKDVTQNNNDVAMNCLMLAVVLFLFYHMLGTIQSIIMELSGARGMAALGEAGINYKQNISGVLSKTAGYGSEIMNKAQSSVTNRSKGAESKGVESKDGGGEGGKRGGSGSSTGSATDTVSSGSSKGGAGGASSPPIDSVKGGDK